MQVERLSEKARKGCDSLILWITYFIETQANTMFMNGQKLQERYLFQGVKKGRIQANQKFSNYLKRKSCKPK
ncbi:hypothetical protein CMI37_15505 [Candidatus Pacearchaeota archaeon]|nr:hypothetical protein [Candidatus Pacearchaeota archaeon]